MPGLGLLTGTTAYNDMDWAIGRRSREAGTSATFGLLGRFEGGNDALEHG